MHFAAKNLLYTFNQSLDTQFVTIAAFKRYTRSPEQRTFKNYFRPSKMQARGVKKGHFTAYMRQRPQFSLSRYIALHRRKKNPILCTVAKQLKTTLLETLQHLKINLPLSGLLPKNFFPQNKPISKTDQTTLTPCIQITKNNKRQASAQKNKPIQTHFHMTRQREANLIQKNRKKNIVMLKSYESDCICKE